MKNKFYLTQILVLSIFIVYLFVSAPAPLPEEDNSGVRVPTQLVLKMANEENKSARVLYTKEIVQAGKKRGLKFDEEWQESHIVAGPLPAQFLRETAIYLEKSPVRLGLYLGSDFPINKVNQLSGQQLTQFNQMKIKLKDVYFHIPDDQTYVYMSPDVAISKACVSCHNEHKQTPKNDWKMSDVMGATTWLYPDETVSLKDAIKILTELRNGFRYSYEYFLAEMSQLEKPPVVGKKWPNEGYFVPSVEVFMKKLTGNASSTSLETIIQAVNGHKETNNDDKEKG